MSSSLNPLTKTDPLIGRVLLGRYRVVSRMARGGMGLVYLGRAEGAEGFVKPVVIKRVLPELETDASTQQMFIREARILSRLSHPNVVSIIDFGIDADAYVMVLEYVRGYDLRRWNKWVWRTRAPMALDLAVHVTGQILDALDYAHNLGDGTGNLARILHRDITPSNVLISAEGQVMLVDFGIAKDTSVESEFKTEAGSVKGKFPYLAPELFGGEEPTPRSEIYACGALLRELLVGKNVFRGKDAVATVQRVLYEPIRPMREERPDVPEELDAVVSKAMARSPADRYQSAEDMRRALDAALPRDADGVRRKFRDAIRSDFFGVMPEALGLAPLDEVAAALEQTFDDRPPPIESEPPTRVERPLRDPTGDVSPNLPAPSEERRARGSHVWALAAAVAITSLVAGAVAMVLLNRPEPPEVVIHDESSRDGSDVASAQSATPPVVGAAVETADAGVSEPDDDQPNDDESTDRARRPAARRPPRSASSGGMMRGLQLAVAGRQAAFERCFETHAEQLNGAPEVTLRFSVAADGQLQSVDVLPPAIAGTPVGRCLHGVARGISFDPVGEPVSFRIPLRARVRR